jgi:hypothetical protein
MSPCGFGKEKTLQNSDFAGGGGGGMDFLPSIASSNTNPNIFFVFFFLSFRKQIGQDACLKSSQSSPEASESLLHNIFR